MSIRGSVLMLAHMDIFFVSCTNRGASDNFTGRASICFLRVDSLNARSESAGAFAVVPLLCVYDEPGGSHSGDGGEPRPEYLPVAHCD